MKKKILMAPALALVLMFAAATALAAGSRWTGLTAAAHNFPAQPFAVMNEGCASVSFNEMQYPPSASEGGKPALNIRGVLAIGNTDEAFQQLTGAAVIRSRDPAMTAQDVRAAIEAGDTTDLFHMALDADTLDLIADGLLAPLSASETLTEDVQGMTPVLREALMDHDKLYAVPSIISPLVWRGDRESPDTYAALLSQAGSAFAAVYDDGSPWTKRQYASAVLKTFIAESAQDAGTVDFSASAFAGTLRALRKAELTPDADTASLTVLQPMQVLSLSGSFPANLPNRGVRMTGEASGYADDPQWLLPPTVTPGARPIVPTTAFVYLLSANAQNPDTAVAYLEYIATHRLPKAEGLMKPESAGPVLYPDAQEKLEQTDGAVRAAILAAPGSWAIAQPRLDAYRSTFLPCLDMQLHPLRRHEPFARMLDTVMAYVEGDETLDTCLENLRMIAEGR